MRVLPVFAAVAVSACGLGVEFREPIKPDGSAKNVFMAATQTLCDGNAYGGELVTRDAADDDFRKETLIMGPAVCVGDSVQIPLAVGDDRSRIWYITPTRAGFQLKHDHRHKDGTKDALTWYGGDSFGEGTAIRQIFPVDAETRALFTREGIEVSNQNTWAVEVRPAEQFVYEMWRPNRHFKIEFDLTEPVAAPPLPWAWEPIE